MLIRIFIFPLLLSINFYCNESSGAQEIMNKKNDIFEQDSTKIDPKGLPEEYKDQNYLYRVYDPGAKTQSPNAMVVYEDGSVFRYADVVMVFEDGKLVSNEVPLEWRLETKIKKESVDNIKTLILNFKLNEPKPESSSQFVEISFYDNDLEKVVLVEGDGSPVNYKVFSKINNEISLGAADSND